MSTGVRDAYDPAWRPALAVRGGAADGLLDGFHAERRPAGDEGVGRAVRPARAGIDASGSVGPPRVHDRARSFRTAYPGRPGEALLIRPDGCPAARIHPASP